MGNQSVSILVAIGTSSDEYREIIGTAEGIHTVMRKFILSLQIKSQAKF